MGPPDGSAGPLHAPQRPQYAHRGGLQYEPGRLSCCKWFLRCDCPSRLVCAPILVCVSRTQESAGLYESAEIRIISISNEMNSQSYRLSVNSARLVHERDLLLRRALARHGTAHAQQHHTRRLAISLHCTYARPPNACERSLRRKQEVFRQSSLLEVAEAHEAARHERVAFAAQSPPPSEACRGPS